MQRTQFTFFFVAKRINAKKTQLNAAHALKVEKIAIEWNEICHENTLGNK